MTDKQAHKQWHVVYTRSRAEKKVLRELHDCKIECFLPMQKQLRQWKDRKKWVEMPLIPGYCFVNISRKEYDQVLQLSNVVQYVRFERKAAIISEQEIEALQTMLHQFDFEVAITMENFEPGKRVEVIEGPMVGLKGELVEMRGKNKFALRLEQIETSFLVEIPAHYLSAVPELKK
ncbi:UpxY family transcription antiterminator [uncultured Draconibacterium sp.]|uniref:UpxY family transcription antiterminator n=1 Tax=uncultured Draconibacterium sp. TaxID=1573823 RepID=UPI003260456F